MTPDERLDQNLRTLRSATSSMGHLPRSYPGPSRRFIETIPGLSFTRSSIK